MEQEVLVVVKEEEKAMVGAGTQICTRTKDTGPFMTLDTNISSDKWLQKISFCEAAQLFHSNPICQN